MFQNCNLSSSINSQSEILSKLGVWLHISNCILVSSLKSTGCLTLNHIAILSYFILIFQIFGPFWIEPVFSDRCQIVCSCENDPGVAVESFFCEDFRSKRRFLGYNIDNLDRFSLNLFCFDNILFPVSSLNNNIDDLTIACHSFFSFDYFLNSWYFSDRRLLSDNFLNFLLLDLLSRELNFCDFLGLNCNFLLSYSSNIHQSDFLSLFVVNTGNLNALSTVTLAHNVNFLNSIAFFDSDSFYRFSHQLWHLHFYV